MGLPSRLLLATLALALGACSIFFNLDADQCSNDDGCAKFGDYTCNAERVCVPRHPDTSSTTTTGSTGGSTPMPECATNQDCITARSGEPYICRDAQCQPLTLEGQCPFVFAGPDDDHPTDYLTRNGAPPLIFGAYAPINVGAPKSHPYTLNYRFAIEELMTATNGIGTLHRPFVMVLCTSTKPDIPKSMAHLLDTVDVKAVLAALPSSSLSVAFDETLQRKKKVFVINPFQADESLRSIVDEGRLWHMLGAYTDLVPSYVAFINSVAAYVRTDAGLDPTAPLRVALVDTKNVNFSTDIGSLLPTAVTINGGLALNDQANKGQYLHITTDSSTQVVNPDTSAAVNSLLTFQPHIVISLGTNEFIRSIVPTLEQSYASNPPPYKPFYVLSPVHGFDGQLTSGTYFEPAFMKSVYARMGGVNFASYEDRTLYNTYIDFLKARFPGQAGLDGRENLYDAAYFLMYSMASASLATPNFDGDEVADGMRKLLNLTSGNHYDVGRGQKGRTPNDLINELAIGNEVALWGTLGPPDFNLNSGARHSTGSVYCVDQTGATQFDALRYNAQTQTLEGTFVCNTALSP